MALDEGVSDLIGRIYESVASQSAWEGLLHDVRERVGARCLMQSISDLQHGAMHQSIVVGDQRRPDGAEEYRAKAFELDVSFRWACTHPHARFCDTENLFSRDAHARDDFTRWNEHEWLGTRHWIVGYTAPSDDLVFGLSAHAWPERGTLSADKKQLFKLLFEHMERALRLHVSPPDFVEGHKPQILVDRSGYVRAISQAAGNLIEADDGLSIWQGRLYASDSLSMARLNAAIRSTLNVLVDGGFGGAVSIARPSGKRDLLITVTPLLSSLSSFEAFRPAALVRIVDPEASPPASAAIRWQQLFDFTPAEGRFVEELMARDLNVRQTADAIGISYATARVHLKHVLDKTAAHSQAQLSRLLTRLE